MRIVICLLVLLGLAATGFAADKPAYRVLARDKGHVAIVNAKGEVEWEVACNHDAHDIALLPNGNVLMPLSATKIVEMSPEKKVVWEYESKPTAANKGRVEVHSFQRLAADVTLIAESGNKRLIEVDRAGKIIREIPLTVDKPDAHRDTRLVRKLANGHYLVCHEGDGKVREYDAAGKVVWSYTLDLAGRPRSPGHGPEGHGTEVFGAIRRPNGNTIIAGGNNNRVIEVDKEGKIVWSIGHDELPGIRLAWVTTLELLPNGNLIVGNCHAGPDNPQLFEVTREKKVVWTFKDFKNFGNDVAAAQVLGHQGESGALRSPRKLNHKEHKGHQEDNSFFFVSFVSFVVQFFRRLPSVDRRIVGGGDTRTAKQAVARGRHRGRRGIVRHPGCVVVGHRRGVVRHRRGVIVRGDRWAVVRHSRRRVVVRHGRRRDDDGLGGCLAGTEQEQGHREQGERHDPSSLSHDAPPVV